MTTFDVPAFVQDSIARREAAQRAHRPCAGDGGRCDQPGRHRCARFGGSWCDQHWTQLGVATPQPDPERTAAALRQRAGVTVLSLSETVLDSRARASGKRASGAMRRAAHDDDSAVRLVYLDVIGAIAASGEAFSANDVRHLLPDDLPAGRVGALWNAAVRHHKLVEVGRVRSTDPATNGHRIPLWQVSS